MNNLPVPPGGAKETGMSGAGKSASIDWRALLRRHADNVWHGRAPDASGMPQLVMALGPLADDAMKIVEAYAAGARTTRGSERLPAAFSTRLDLILNGVEAALASPWLDQLIAAAPDPHAQAELARQFGSHRLMRLASAEPLGEPARELAMSYLKAYADEVRDPARLSQLIEQLADTSIDDQYAATLELRGRHSMEGGSH